MKKINSIIILIQIIFISCSKDDAPKISLEDNSSILTSSEEQELYNYGGTSCWIVRTTELDINTPVTYEYRSNQGLNTAFWEVEYGNVKILSGQNTDVLTVEFSENFENTKINVQNVTPSDPRCCLCADGVIITESTQ